MTTLRLARELGERIKSWWVMAIDKAKEQAWWARTKSRRRIRVVVKPCEPSAKAKASLSKSQDKRIQVLWARQVTSQRAWVLWAMTKVRAKVEALWVKAIVKTSNSYVISPRSTIWPWLRRTMWSMSCGETSSLCWPSQSRCGPWQENKLWTMPREHDVLKQSFKCYILMIRKERNLS